MRRFIFLLFFLTQIHTIGYCQSAEYKKETDSIEGILKTLPADTNRVNALSSLFSQYRRSDFLKALEIAEEELELSRKLHFLSGEARAYRHLGVSYYSIGDKNQAVAFYMEAIKQYGKLKDSYYVAACHNNIGLVYLDERNYNEAWKYFNKAYSIWKTFTNQEGMAIVLNNMADLSGLQGKDSLALIYNLKALVVAKQVGANVGAVWFSIAGVYIKKKEYPAARRYLDSAFTYSREKNDIGLQLSVQLALGKIYSDENAYENAIGAIKKAKILAVQIGDQFSETETIALLADVHASKGDFHSAYKLQREFNDKQDSLHKRSNTMRIEQLVYVHELERKNLQSQALLKNKKLKEAQIMIYQATIQRQYAWGALIGIALLAFVMLSVFYFRSYTRERKDMDLLKMKNQEIELRNEEIRNGNLEIKAQQESLAILNAKQNKLFSIIAHDLRSPLNSVKSIVVLFRSNLITGEQTEQLLERLLNTLNHTSEFLENLLYWAQNQMQGTEVSKQVFDLNKVIMKSINLLREQADAKQIILKNNVTESCEIFADAEMINVVIRNLISNAIKFSRVHDTVSVSAAREAGDVRVYIEDTGVGMSDEVIKKIMRNHEFYSTRGTKNEKGTGIGINLCMEFLKKNGGTLEVKSKPGTGSIFMLTLPGAVV